MSTTPNQTDDLLSYKRSELACVADLKRIQDLAVKTTINDDILTLVRDVLERVENKRFAIGVLGEFKRGKSTFINALLEKEILPSDILPCSAVINRVTYALNPAVFIHFKPTNDGTPGKVEQISIDQLSEYVTQLTPTSKGNAAQIEEAVVEYPTPYCKNGVDIIDTPGLNDNDDMTAVTMSVIPKVDAAILVIMPEAPFAGTEGDFLTKHLLLQDLGRIIFVVNAIDRIRKLADRTRIVDEIRRRIVEAVEQRLKEQFTPGSEEYVRYRQQIGVPKVFPISAQLALEAHERNDQRLLKESQFEVFTSALNHFLVCGRGAVELQVMANRIVATADEITKKINIELGALAMEGRDFQAAYEASMQQLEDLRRKRDGELAAISDAATRTGQRLEPVVARIGEELKRTALEVVDKAQLTPEELESSAKKATLERINKDVGAAMQQRGQRIMESLQVELERDFRTESARLQDFAVSVGSTLSSIEGRFGLVDVSASPEQSVAHQSIAAALSAFTGFGGIWSGYREAGLKGAAVGGVASLGTAVAGGLVAGILSLPLTGPLFLAIGIASIFTGGFAAKWLFKGDRLERFHEKYRAAISDQIDEELAKRNLQAEINKSVEDVYDILRKKVIAEATASLEQTQSTLEHLGETKARNEVMSDNTRHEKEGVREEVAAIRSKALRLTNQLTVSASV